MAVRPSRTNDAIRQRRMLQIESAALAVFARHGYVRTKTSMIAEQAGVSEGLIYRYYESKEQLFHKIVEGLLKESRKEISSLQHLEGSPLEQIRLLTQNMLDEQNKMAFKLIEQARKEEEVPRQITELMKNYSDRNLLEYLIPLFVEGQKKGELIAGDPKKILSWYFHIVHLIITDERGDPEFGFPDTDLLLNLIRKTGK